MLTLLPLLFHPLSQAIFMVSNPPHINIGSDMSSTFVYYGPQDFTVEGPAVWTDDIEDSCNWDNAHLQSLVQGRVVIYMGVLWEGCSLGEKHRSISRAGALTLVRIVNQDPPWCWVVSP